ncbi:MAG TPA: peptide deformylase [Thermoanaerobaculia bacterium]|nr:peptide deformylase [Thermoanaerobaculia bacterium]
MAVLPIVKYGNDVLRRRAENVTDFDDALQRFIDDMVDTMYAAPGIGLAANQIGDSRRVAVVDLSVGKRPGELHVLINPEIEKIEGIVTEDEGCLSIPDFTETVARPEQMHVRFVDRNGQPRDMWGQGLMARALSHEIDHLDGRMFIDRLRGFKRDRIVRKIQKLAKAGMW